MSAGDATGSSAIVVSEACEPTRCKRCGPLQLQVCPPAGTVSFRIRATLKGGLATQQHFLPRCFSPVDVLPQYGVADVYFFLPSYEPIIVDGAAEFFESSVAPTTLIMEAETNLLEDALGDGPKQLKRLLKLLLSHGYFTGQLKTESEIDRRSQAATGNPEFKRMATGGVVGGEGSGGGKKGSGDRVYKGDMKGASGREREGGDPRGRSVVGGLGNRRRRTLRSPGRRLSESMRWEEAGTDKVFIFFERGRPNGRTRARDRESPPG